jgi:hypothetical protein
MIHIGVIMRFVCLFRMSIKAPASAAQQADLLAQPAAVCLPGCYGHALREWMCVCREGVKR